MNEREWANCIAAGDATAQRDFVTAYHASVFRWLRYLTSSDEAAQDLSQETFLEALQNAGSFQGRSTLATWLHRIAYYRYTNWLRDANKARERQTTLADADFLVDPRDAANWESLCLREALSKLSEEHRDTFILYHVQELSVQEAAETLGIPPGTVQSRLYHARQRLRELLSDDWIPSEKESAQSQSASERCKSVKKTASEVVLK